ncbi:MAG: pyridoxamine 5'-phosphate oxidase family protein [Lachnospiraceae bacterium]|nr:pyridoxamine 5'-phosphate oxidase family protein [Lachnospiraceae bacterium]
MFRPVRRKKNEISAEEARELLCSSRIGILAVNGDDGYPYAIPINYFYDTENEKIIFHGSRVGHKVDALKKCDKVCFTVIGNETVKGEAWAPYAKSAVVFGRCRPIEDPEETLKTLKRFAMKYYPDEQTADEEIERSAKAVRMFEITVEHVSGKEVQER